MSQANPRKAINALLPLSIEAGGVTIQPMTLGLYAALEKIGSPLLTGETVQTLDWLPTLYLMTHDPEEALVGNLADKAFAWAKTQPVTIVESIRRAAFVQMGRVEDVLPQAKKKRTRPNKVTTAGSSNGSTTPPVATAGTTAKSCGKSRPRRSRSF